MAASSGGKESTRSHWEEFWEEKKDVGEVYSNADRILRNLSSVVELRGKKILEIGAGTGRDSFSLVRRGADVYQLDYSFNSLVILSRLAVEEGVPTTIVGGDTFHLPFRDSSFDVVFHQGLLEHFRHPYADRLLHENVRVLKSGGLLLVDVPQRYHLYTIAKHIMIALNKWFAGWERSFSMRELKGEMSNLGLTPVSAYGEWMVPSFAYRVTREILKKAGVKLPLYPKLHILTGLRSSLRTFLQKTSLPLYTGISIGVIGRK